MPTTKHHRPCKRSARATRACDLRPAEHDSVIAVEFDTINGACVPPESVEDVARPYIPHKHVLVGAARDDAAVVLGAVLCAHT